MLLRDRLVEERLFDGSGPVTLGQSLRCTLSIPVDGVPKEHILFARDQGRWVLRTFAEMEGRLGVGDKLTVLEGVREVPLEKSSRGKLKIGEATILFQDVAKPPVQPRPQLPASVRESLVDRIDRKLAVIIGGSLLVHIGIAAYAWAMDRELPPSLVSQIEPYHIDKVPPQEMIVVSVADPIPNPKLPGVAAPVAPAHPTTPTHAQTQHIVQTPHPIDRPMDPAKLAAILAEGVSGPSSITPSQDIADRHPGGKLDKQLAEIARTKQPVTIGNPNRSSRGGDPNAIETPDRPLTGDPTLVETKHEDAGDKGRLIFDPIKDPTEPPMSETVLSKINGLYKPGLQRCYRLELKTDPTLSGKITINFTIDERGHVIDPEAAGSTRSLDKCVQSYMGTWLFPVQKDAHGEPQERTFHASLALLPT